MEKYCILGGGLSGRAAERLLKAYGIEAPILCDAPGLDADAALAPFDRIVTSPGVKPLVSKLHQATMARVRAGSAELWSEMELGFRLLPKGTRVLAVTGTNGKTTTTELTVYLLQSLGVPARPAGNIGFPLSDVAAEMKEQDLDAKTALPVVEVSSFQLERTFSFAPEAAVLINLESDHEDRYQGGFAEYCAVKRSIFDRVPEGNRIFGLSMKEGDAARRVKWHGDALTIDGRPLLMAGETQLGAPHNRENLAAALELVIRIVPAEKLFSSPFRKALKAFHPGKHRIEKVFSHHGIAAVDDSKATNPASVIAAVKALETSGRATICLLLGGLDKAMDFTPLKTIAPAVKTAWCYGEARNRIMEAVGGAFPCIDCGTDFERAVREAAGAAVSGDTVLLSPACASMDLFKDYKERGETFARLAKRFLKRDKNER